MLGKFYGIGVGPGDPELLTLKAYRVLKEIDVVCIPVSQPNKPGIAFEIVSQAIKRDWEVLKLHLPMTQDNDRLEQHWQEAAEQVGRILKLGKDVAFITLGDPSFYSTYIYLVRKLKNMFSNLNVQIIPGISAPNALAAEAQVPLVESGEKLLVIPGISDLGEISEALDNYENIMFLKVGKTFPEVFSLLKGKGLDKKAVFASRCGFSDGYITKDLDEIKNKLHDYLSVLLVKKGGLE